MLEILRTEDREIKAVLEWWLVNIDGSFNPNGDTVWLAEIEVAPKYRNDGIIKQFINIVADKVPNAKAGYFWRKRKYPDRKPKLYTRKQWLKLTK